MTSDNRVSFMSASRRFITISAIASTGLVGVALLVIPWVLLLTNSKSPLPSVNGFALGVGFTFCQMLGIACIAGTAQAFRSAVYRISPSRTQMVPLSPKTKRRLDAMFPAAERAAAERLLIERCGNGLPFSQNDDMYQLERVRFAALKLSGGKLSGLESAVDLANTNWRDLLMGAGFGEDINAHKRWFSA